MSDLELRREALHLAVNANTGEVAHDVVSRAMQYFAFLRGTSDIPGIAPTPIDADRIWDAIKSVSGR